MIAAPGDAILLSARAKQVMDRLLAGDSMVVVAPEQYGKWTLLSACLRATKRTKVILDVGAVTRDGGLDFPSLWASITAQTGIKTRQAVKDAATFSAAIATAVRAPSAPLSLALRAPSVGRSAAGLECLGVLHRTLVNGGPGLSQQLQIAATDDYSILDLRQSGNLLSDFYTMACVYLVPLAKDELVPALQVLFPFEDQNGIAAWAEAIIAATAGHPGLVHECLQRLPVLLHDAGTVSRKHLVARALSNSAVLDDLMRGLDDDVETYARLAMVYEEPNTLEFGGSRARRLRQLGLIVRDTPPLHRVPGGVLGDAVRRLGAVVRSKHPRLVAPDSAALAPVADPSPQLSDSDFVVLHLSDLHLGEHYRFRLKLDSRDHNPDAPALPDLILDDLTALGLRDRVDALLISGDSSNYADEAEFRRATQLVTALLSVCGLDRSRLLCIPGNHDIRWDANPLSEEPRPGGASAANYKLFAEALGCPSVDGCASMLIQRRDHRARLLVLGLDSTAVESKAAAGIGRIARSAFEAARRLQDAERAKTPEALVTWLMIHHHLVPVTAATTSAAEHRHVSVLANASELSSFAMLAGAEVVCHGHEHHPSISVVTQWPGTQNEPARSLVVVGAGSASISSAHTGDFGRNQYYVLLRRDGELLALSRWLSPDGTRFVRHEARRVHLSGG